MVVDSDCPDGSTPLPACGFPVGALCLLRGRADMLAMFMVFFKHRPMIRQFTFTIMAVLTQPMLAMANCIPPWQTLFACEIEGSEARAEFCQISEPQKHPTQSEGYYTFAHGPEMAELYFETNEVVASNKDAAHRQVSHFNPAIGFVRGGYVYAFFANGISDPGVEPVEIRVYDAVEKFMNDEPGNELERLVCDPASVVIDPLVVIP